MKKLLLIIGSVCLVSAQSGRYELKEIVISQYDYDGEKVEDGKRKL